MAAVSGLVNAQGLESLPEVENQTLPSESIPIAKGKQGAHLHAPDSQVCQYCYYRAQISVCAAHVEIYPQPKWVSFALL